MPTVDRRRFLQLTGGATAASMLSAPIARAASIPAHREHGSIRDVEHIVVLMQENRSFDHYFGTMRGVRGFGDPHPATLPSGKSVFHQSDGTKDVLPFRPDMDDLGLAFIQDLDHGWEGGHAAFNAGNYDKWVPVKSSTTMAHLERRDMPFHYALADAFTICDSYHCSLLGPTDPNRYYMWTGWVGNDHKGGGPVIANDEKGYSWQTYPERLQAAGVSWKVYQDVGAGLDAADYWGWGSDAYIGNYGDNSLLYFTQYQNSKPGSALYERALRGTDVKTSGLFFDQLRADVRGGTLPQVSYVVAPEAFTEHPNWPANYGAWYVSQVLDALTSDPDVWSKTALLINFDENDGFFDHVVPAYPNVGTLPGASTVSTENEFFDGTTTTPGGSVGTPGPYGLGQRVPLLVVSPWSTGGWVCSETFDHTSVIRFIEARFGVHEPQITPWRRAVAGDLTSAFDFGRRRTRTPDLPSTAAYKPKDDQRHPDYVPTPPAQGRLPRQEHGVRPSRSLGYRLAADGMLDGFALRLSFVNGGRLGANFQVRPRAQAPSSYTVGAGHRLGAEVPVAGPYDVELHGPNGFFRRFAGTAAKHSVEVAAEQDANTHRLLLQLSNPTSSAQTLEFADAYRSRTRSLRLEPRSQHRVELDTGDAGGWYDVTITVRGDTGYLRQLAGRLDNGGPAISDPQLGR
ncbi:phosphocholine-specific phospholipase C [uncultured Jatrophihabitans sp.]|uniref:phosphocholine-specific phospholipase C n=1 Tax=uncultured Jatrophihabitans sp. TaxID=1610747 RepID=UPI0035CA69D0